MNKRHLKILKILSNHEQVDVSELAELCDVSTVTIRKDLDNLENRELVIREHGFARINNLDNINYRLAIEYEEKEKIAQKAIQIIEPNETVMIESGSCNTLLALEIAKKDQNNTIITNSSFIARYLKDYPKTKIILLGGEYQSSSGALVGNLVSTFLNNFNVDKFFIGTDGLSLEHGITGSDYDRVETVKIMRNFSTHTYVLSQSHKFNKRSSFKIMDLEDIDHIFTDEVDDEIKSSLKKLNIKYT